MQRRVQSVQLNLRNPHGVRCLPVQCAHPSLQGVLQLQLAMLVQNTSPQNAFHLPFLLILSHCIQKKRKKQAAGGTIVQGLST